MTALFDGKSESSAAFVFLINVIVYPADEYYF
jgi:hypothetical protein